MRRRDLVVSLLFAVPVSAAACASSGPDAATEDSAAGGPCDEGDRVLVVQNHAGDRLDIFERRRARSGRTLIETLGSGTHELAVENEEGYFYTAQFVGEQTVVATTGPSRTRGRQAVELRTACRT